MKETNEYDVLLKIVEVIETKITLQHSPVSTQSLEKIEIGVKKINLIINKSQKNMGDKINIKNSQIGATGSKSQSINNTFNQNNAPLPQDFDFNRINEELLVLRQKLITQAKGPEEFKALAEVASAEEASRKKDGEGVLTHLKSAGKWVFDTAKEIGIDVVTEIIKKQIEV